MKELSLYLTLLLLLNSTPLYNQSGTARDTSRCYGLTQLRLIAKTAVDLTTCDTLLSNSKKKLANRDTVIKEKDYQISQYLLTIGIKDQFIKNREDSIVKQQKHIKKLNRQKKWIKVGWAATTIAEAALIIYFMIN